MKIMIMHLPHPTIGCRLPDEKLPPMGLLVLTGHLLSEGHQVSLVDGEASSRSIREIQQEAKQHGPDVVLFSHAGVSPADPIITEVSRAMREVLPNVTLVAGGIYPICFWRQVLRCQPQIDVVVRGEGEDIVRRLIRALAKKAPLDSVEGVAFRNAGVAISTRSPQSVTNRRHNRLDWGAIHQFMH